MSSLLSLLKEIREQQNLQPTQNSLEINNEIESLFKHFNINQPNTDLPNFQFLKAYSTQHFLNKDQQLEVNYYQQKQSVLLPLIMNNYNRLSSSSPAPSVNNNILRSLGGLPNISLLRNSEQPPFEPPQPTPEEIIDQQKLQLLQQ